MVRAADRLLQACLSAAWIAFTPDSEVGRAGEALRTAYGRGGSEDLPADMAALLEQLADAPTRN